MRGVEGIPGHMKYDFFFLQTAYVASVVVESGPAPIVGLETLYPLNVPRIRTRERASIKRARQVASYIGVGVTPEGQRLFDLMVKSLPCRWEKDVIVVLDSVQILPPYRVANMKPLTHATQRELDMVSSALQQKWAVLT